MFSKVLGKLLDSNENKLKKLEPIVKQINSYEEEFKKLSDEEIKEKTRNWQSELRKEDITDEEIKKRLDEILPEAYALVKEASRRTMNQSHRDVQLMAGIVLHQGKIAEQKTGEGKTLTATLPLYLNSLAGRGAHLVTPNDYLSKHAVGWYGPVYEMLGIDAGVIVHEEAFVYDSEYVNEEINDMYLTHLKPISRLKAYRCDVTYGTNSEFGFDFLRDNMKQQVWELVQSNPNKDYFAHNFAIVDEVDNILIDIARTPLIISSSKDLPPEMYAKFAQLAEGLVEETDYTIDEKFRVVTLSEIGIRKIERKLGVENLYEKDFATVHHIENALKAKALFIKDKDYVVKDGEVIIVDQNTGRLLHGNRWSNGVHQAVEAKEGVEIKPESKTMATITYQNYFRMYDKLAGMTGTAITEADEFYKFYELDVIVIPTYKPIARIDQSDLVYKTESAKFRAVARDIAERHKKGQPILIGTTTVEKSQLLSTYLKRLKIPHQILNAKNHEKEAHIIAQAGRKGSVTVATNMAGRGVDIILGGDPFDEDKYKEIIELGGLYVIGTERHESRRIDNQLRGRAGRQGDVGESRFYLSLQDFLLRVFGGDKIESMMGRLGVDENMPIEARLISRTIESAQKKVEGMNFDQRQNLVKYDDVMTIQRETVYEMRREILFSEDDKEGFLNWVLEKLEPYKTESFDRTWKKNLEKYGQDVWYEAVKQISLQIIDTLWVDHIDAMDELKDGVRLRGYGQVDPLVEYKREGKLMFERLVNEIWYTVADRLEKIKVEVQAVDEKGAEINNNDQAVDGQLVSKGDKILSDSPENLLKEADYKSGELKSGVEDEVEELAKERLEEMNLSNSDITSNGSANGKKKLGRNDLCWCGSGKKYKKCHGRFE